MKCPYCNCKSYSEKDGCPSWICPSNNCKEIEVKVDGKVYKAVIK